MDTLELRWLEGGAMTGEGSCMGAKTSLINLSIVKVEPSDLGAAMRPIWLDPLSSSSRFHSITKTAGGVTFFISVVQRIIINPVSSPP